MCAECQILRRQNKVLREKVLQLRLVIKDMAGPDADLKEDPFEDEMPLVPWGNDR